MAQWLRCHAPNVGDSGLILGQGTRSHMLQTKPWCSQINIKNKKQKKTMLGSSPFDSSRILPGRFRATWSEFQNFQNSTCGIFSCPRTGSEMFSTWVLEHPGQVVEFSFWQGSRMFRSELSKPVLRHLVTEQSILEKTLTEGDRGRFGGLFLGFFQTH